MDAVVEWERAGRSPVEFVSSIEAQARRLTTTYDQGTVAWRAWGNGPPLVLLHGGFGAWTHWIRNVSALSARYRVLAADMPGFGDSTDAPQPLAPEKLADALAGGLREVTGEEPVRIAGFSFGAVVGGLIAQRALVKVHALVLVGAVGMGLQRGPMEFKRWRRIGDDAERREAHRANLATLMIWDTSKIDDLAIFLQDRNTSRARVQSRPIARTALLRNAMENTDAALAGIWGEHDATATPWLDERRELLRQLRPHAPFEVIADAGHWVQYEAADQFNAALIGILGSLGKARP